MLIVLIKFSSRNKIISLFLLIRIIIISDHNKHIAYKEEKGFVIIICNLIFLLLYFDQEMTKSGHK